MTDTPDLIDGIAIVGMAGRFPDAPDIAALWQNLCAGRESIRCFTDAELLAEGVDPALLALPNYVRARGSLGDAEYFDAAFFGHSPRVAELMDPQHRLFLECAWAALEHAGYDPARFGGRVGVYAGESMNTYLLNNLLARIQMVASVDSLQAAIGNDKDSLTTEVAYKLNLTGPSITVQTASSTSLVAVHVACQALLAYECDMALAGGVSLHFPERAGYLYQEGGATSPDGHCRAFDAEAKGFVNGHGAGVVVLRRLEQALEDGDTIYAVIRGSAVNNDGALKVSYMAPSVEGQAQVIALAQALAGVAPDTIGYIEAHGTGTALGDPIEVAALTQAFRAGTDRRQFCAIGSIKPNIGHLDTAAGVAGLIKAALTVHHGTIPPSINYRAPNPQIDFASSPFFVNTALRAWPDDGGPRRAGVSSFGMGGTNAHVVIEQAPAPEPPGESRPHQLLVLSAKTAGALEAATANLAAHLRAHPEQDLADVAFTLMAGRRPFTHRRALLCRDRADALAALEARDPARLLGGVEEPRSRPLIFMFSGQGSQYAGMGHGLYRSEPAFRAAVDRCAELLRPHLGLDVRALLFPEATTDDRPMGEPGVRSQGAEATVSHDPDMGATDTSPAASGSRWSAAGDLTDTQYAQPALFVVEYALATLLMSWGLAPSALVGHSVGEYVAATLAGVFTLEDALGLVAARGRLMASCAPGAMLAVPLPERALLPLLGPGLELAAVNTPEHCVVAGPAAALAQFERELADRGVTPRRLHTSHAFHTAMMEPILERFIALVRACGPQPPRLPFISNLSGGWISAEQASDPVYWGRHLRQTVRFSDGLAALLQEPDALLVEVGPGQALSTFARQHPARAGQPVLAALRHPRQQADDQAFLLDVLGRLWLAGAPVDPAGLYAGERRRRVPLPVYPFERQRYLAEPTTQTARPQTGKRPDVGSWFYAPLWRPTLPPAPQAPASGWLVFADPCGLGQRLAGRLAAQGQPAALVTPGAHFAQNSAGYTIDPASPADYARLLDALRANDRRFSRVLHLWSVTAERAGPPDRASFAAAQALGFDSLLLLAQALAAQGPDEARIVAVSNNMQAVAGETWLAPEKATLLGLCRVLGQEHPQLGCRSVDVVLPPDGSWRRARLEELLLAECQADDSAAVAYRDGQRLAQAFEPVGAVAGGGAKLRQRGVYLITGGLGEIGLALAAHLADAASARLVLAGRAGLPERDTWDGWLAAHPPEDRTSRRIRAVREIEARGGEVLVARADVADPAQIAALLAQVDERFGALHGVIHAAGTIERAAFAPIRSAAGSSSSEHFGAKAHGLLALADALAGRDLDFCLLLSSLAALLGGLGFAAYAAANSFMDAFACAARRDGPLPWLSVGWDAWQTGETLAHTSAGEGVAAYAMSDAEGAQAFERALGMADLPHLLLSTGDLRARAAQWLGGPPADEPAAQPETHPRPHLQNPYVAPRSQTERAVAEVWQRALGIEQVGVHDNFFDLGGNSLTGLHLIDALGKRLGVAISAISLYEGPTVAALAELIDQAASGDTPDERQSSHRSRGERRREKRRARHE